MLTAASEKSDGNYERTAIVFEIDEDALQRAKEIFASYKERGAILNDDFDDAAWVISDQVQTVNLKLAAFEASYHKNAREWIGCDYRCYIKCVKAYIAFNLGVFGIATLRTLANIFTGLTAMTSDIALGIDDCVKHVIGLLQIIPDSNELRDLVIETLEEKAERKAWNKREGQQRTLADFKTYCNCSEP